MTPTPKTTARYDGLAEWYDDHNAAAADSNREPLLDLLGPGDGLCLDVGCGTGQNLQTLHSTGRTVVGLEYSADQLGLAQQRAADGKALVQGDAAELPFADAVFSTVAVLWLSTDVDDFAAVLREAARVLHPGGVLVFYGAHPCFNGPHTESRPDDGRIVHPTYRTVGWHPPAPWWGEGGIRQRLGMRHVPLADLLNAFAGAGLAITRTVEPRTDPVPWVLALRAEKR
ncbi:methyltransferase family protein [Kribbella sp. VKM Ac-2569]|uniref:class I SAM-dependent methyltransferase n=1 Tax=Kribbella sp. VKM Ac-2569 TaxID=2512220 RepID=UPI00102BDA8A|nr:class I SAM-dependent methyltransferase [Kribbella sp. VKM Ac-2569]RZT26905.1 methyltransferase family protein [Kribbella sp. VKM Ac-2569]